MPTIEYNYQRWSARMTLLARCPGCARFLNWRHELDEELDMKAFCCNLAFLCKHNGKPPLEFTIFAETANLTNVTTLFGYDDDGGPLDGAA